jgi:hypothetical protein
MMETKVSDEYLKHYANRDWTISPDGASMAAELLDLRRDAADSQNHNSGVIDRIYRQLQDAGFHGTLSEMVEQAINPWISVKERLPEKETEQREMYLCKLNRYGEIKIIEWMPLPLPPSEEG